MLYTQRYLNTIVLLNPNDILFMDESSVHINCGVRKYGSVQKGKRAIHFSKHFNGANYTLHVVAGLHGKIYYEVTSGSSMSLTFINFMYNATNAILSDGRYVISGNMHIVLDNAPIHKTYAEDVVR